MELLALITRHQSRQSANLGLQPTYLTASARIVRTIVLDTSTPHEKNLCLVDALELLPWLLAIRNTSRGCGDEEHTFNSPFVLSYDEDGWKNVIQVTEKKIE